MVLGPFCEDSLHPGLGLEQDSKKTIQDVGPSVKPASLSAFLTVAGDLATDFPPSELCLQWVRDLVSEHWMWASNLLPMLMPRSEHDKPGLEQSASHMLLADPSGPCSS